MAEIQGPQTNGDRVAPLIEETRKEMRKLVEYARANPDEALIVSAPIVALALIAASHDISALEILIAVEAGWACGIFALREYRAWKARPARPLPNFWKVS